MRIIKQSTIYECDICGARSENKKWIEECEKKGRPIPLVNVGDVVYFKDCEETPILFGEEKKAPHNTHLFDKNIVGKTMRLARQLFLNQLCKYEVAEIKICGHKIEYFLKGIKGESVHFTAGFEFEYVWHYPTIYGNDFMEKVLREYNS